MNILRTIRVVRQGEARLINRSPPTTLPTLFIYSTPSRLPEHRGSALGYLPQAAAR